MRSAIAIILLLLSTLFDLPAQVLDSIQLDSIEVRATSLRSTIAGEVNIRWDNKQLTNFASSNLSEVLQGSGTAFVKSYGLGSIATTSIRGGSAEHTAVLWNGIPIQNRMLGQSDFSLINPLLLDQVNIQLGGSATLWGSGAIAGAINLQNRPRFGNKMELTSMSSVGSFQQYGQHVRLNLSRPKWSSCTALFHDRANNNFPYSTSKGGQQINQTNNHYRSTGGMQSVYYQPNPQSRIGLNLWVQDTEREIPPRTSQRRSDAEQRDQFIRSMLTYKKIFNGSTLEGKVSYFNEYQKFIDDQILLKAEHRIQTSTAEFNYETKWRKSMLGLGTTHVYTNATSENYFNISDEMRNAIILSARFSWEKWHLQSGLRQELIDGVLAPLLPNLGLRCMSSSYLEIGGRISRNYRLPTLNDRFWHPGGNPNLEPEHGWSQSINMTVRSRVPRPWLKYRISVFNRHIKDWILWAPAENGIFWQSHNLTSVWSRGLEQRIEFSPKYRWVERLYINHQFVKSTNKNALDIPRINKGEQILYTPIHQGAVGIDLQLKGLFASYRHRFTGAYAGINRQLNSYNIGDLMVRYHSIVWDVPARLSIDIKNLFNNNYQVIEDRPMPGRHYRFTLQLNFTKTKES